MRNHPARRPASDLETVRREVAAVDRQIVALLAKRAALADEAVRFKTSVHDIADPALQEGLLARVTEWAAGSNTPAALARGVYTAILAYSVRRQTEVFRSGRSAKSDGDRTP